MAYKKLILTRDNGVATVTLNRPEVLNALDQELGAELVRAIKEVQDDKEVRVVVLTGAGRGFCAGNDMRGMSARARGETARPPIDEATQRGPGVIALAIMNMPKPVIAAVNGVAVGGGFSIVLACDIVVASENARFSEIFIKRGLIASGGTTFFLPNLIGPAKAMEMLFLGDIIGARDAERLGFVNHVYPADEFEANVRELAEKLAQGPPKAFSFMKRLVKNEGFVSNLESVFKAEDQAQRILFQSEDHKEGVQAYIEKRAPKFRGE